MTTPEKVEAEKWEDLSPFRMDKDAIDEVLAKAPGCCCDLGGQERPAHGCVGQPRRDGWPGLGDDHGQPVQDTGVGSVTRVPPPCSGCRVSVR